MAGAVKNLKPYQGLKPLRPPRRYFDESYGRKKPKTLSGIETWEAEIKLRSEALRQAVKNLKPYQGLKPLWHRSIKRVLYKAVKNLKPYQGLKRLSQTLQYPPHLLLP